MTGSGSGIKLFMDPDPVCPESLNPDPVCPERWDPDPVCPELLDPDPVCSERSLKNFHLFFFGKHSVNAHP